MIATLAALPGFQVQMLELDLGVICRTNVFAGGNLDQTLLSATGWVKAFAKQRKITLVLKKLTKTNLNWKSNEYPALLAIGNYYLHIPTRPFVDFSCKNSSKYHQPKPFWGDQTMQISAVFEGFPLISWWASYWITRPAIASLRSAYRHGQFLTTWCAQVGDGTKWRFGEWSIIFRKLGCA